VEFLTVERLETADSNNAKAIPTMLLQMLTLKRGCLIAILLFVLWILILGVWMLVGPTMTSAHRLTVYTGSNFANNVHITAYASDHSSKDSTFGWKLSHDPHVVPSLLRLFIKVTIRIVNLQSASRKIRLDLGNFLQAISRCMEPVIKSTSVCIGWFTSQEPILT